jgi:D-aminopeptidase
VISGSADASAGLDGPGAAIAVIRNGEVVAMRCSGLANLPHRVPIRRSTRFHIVSVSKTFMAAAVLILAARGRLALDDDIRQHLQELRHPGVVTIRHLLSLTSGLRDVLEVERLRGIWHSAISRRQDLLDLALAQTETSLPAGSAYLYTNVNHLLLEQIVSRASGQSAEAFRREAIYEPLGLTATCGRPDDELPLDDLAEPYVASPEGWIRPRDLLGIAADVLTSNLDDMIKWVLALRDGRIGDVELFPAMSTPTVLSDGRAVYYGLGLAVRRYRGLTVLCHSGSQPGYKAHIAYVPELDLGIVVLSNREEMRPAAEATVLMEWALDGQFPAPHPRMGSPIDARIGGAYVDPQSGEWLSLSVQHTALCAETLGDTAYLYRDADGVFRDRDDYHATVPVEVVLTEGGCRAYLSGRWHSMQPCTGSEFSPEDYIGRYENFENDSIHVIDAVDGLLRIQYGPWFDAGRRFPMEPIAPDMFLVRPTAPGIAYRHVFRFERDQAGQIVAAVVTMERLKGLRLSRSSP